MQALRAPIKRLKDSFVNIISIGVGRNTNPTELRFMASSPSNTHVFSVQNMEQLRTLIGSITASSCTCKLIGCADQLSETRARIWSFMWVIRYLFGYDVGILYEVSWAAVLCVVTQCFLTLRDNTKRRCVRDYL